MTDNARGKPQSIDGYERPEAFVSIIQTEAFMGVGVSGGGQGEDFGDGGMDVGRWDPDEELGLP